MQTPHVWREGSGSSIPSYLWLVGNVNCQWVLFVYFFLGYAVAQPRCVCGSQTGLGPKLCMFIT